MTKISKMPLGLITLPWAVQKLRTLGFAVRDAYPDPGEAS